MSNRKRKVDQRKLFSYPKHSKVEVSASQPSLALLPDNVALKIMSFLDITSLISLSCTNRRYYTLHTDEIIWRDVDLSTLPQLNVQTLKRLVRNKLHPTLWRLTLHSNAMECQRHPKLRPLITSSAMNDIFTKCHYIRNISLHNLDLSQLPKDCLLWSSAHLEMVTFSHCIAPFRWLENVKPYWPQLKQLNLPCTSKTSDHDLLYLAAMNQSYLNLRQLSLKKCYRVSKVGINSLCCSFSNLLYLDLSECSAISQDCLFLIADNMTHLHYLNISNCEPMQSLKSANTFLYKLQANCTHLKLLIISTSQLYLNGTILSRDSLSFKIQCV